MSVTFEPAANNTWKLEVDTGTTPETPTWTPVKGINSFTPAQNYSVQDSSDFDSDGWGSDAITQRKWQVSATVLRKNDGTAYDAGQEALREASMGATVELVHVRWYDTSIATGEAYEGDAYVQWAPSGGAGTALQAVNITLLGQGAPLETTIP